MNRVTLRLLNTATWLIHKTPAILSTNQIPNFKQCAFFLLCVLITTVLIGCYDYFDFGFTDPN